MGRRPAIGKKQCCVATLVERATRFTILVKVDGKSTDKVVPALVALMKKLPHHLKGSLTWDRGVELTAHRNSPWRRTCKSTFAIHNRFGNGVAMKSRTDCYAGTSQKVSPLGNIPRSNSMKWHMSSMVDREKHWAHTLQQRRLPNS